MKYNPNKAVSANSYGINVFYTDSKRFSSVNYDESSNLKTQQETGTQLKDMIYQKVVNETDQQFKKLFNEAMYGLSTYSKEELSKMTYVQKMDIKQRYEIAQRKLNIWKQELVHQKLGSFLTTLFHKSQFAKDLANYSKGVDKFNNCIFTFRDLKVTKEQIQNKLVELGLLPEPQILKLV